MANENVVHLKGGTMDLASALRLVFKGKTITRHDWQGQVKVKMHNGTLSMAGGIDAKTGSPKPMYSPWNITDTDIEASDYIEYSPDLQEMGVTVDQAPTE